MNVGFVGTTERLEIIGTIKGVHCYQESVRLALGVASELVSTGGEKMRENDNSASKCFK